MMTDNTDQLLQSVFAEARQNLDGEALTSRIMARTRNLIIVLAASGISFALVLLTSIWLLFGIPLLEFALLVSQFFTMAQVDLGEGWLALVFMPVNNIASLAVITVKAIHLGWKKAISASFKD